MSIQTKIVKSNDGTEIYAQAAGNPAKPHVVFIHGVCLSAMVFSKQFTDPKLLENLFLVRYDVRGHGRSGMPDTPEAYTSASAAEDFEAVVHAFSLKRPFLLGWSMGATIATDVCTTFGPSFLSGLIYVGGLPYVGDIQHRIGSKKIWRLTHGLLTTNDVGVYSHSQVAFIDSVVVDPAKLPFETKMTWLGCVARQSPDVRKCVLSRSQDPTRLLQEGGKVLPLLLLHGANDSHIKGEVLIEEMRTAFSDFEGKLIPNAGHAVFWDQPERVREEILRFVARTTK